MTFIEIIISIINTILTVIFKIILWTWWIFVPIKLWKVFKKKWMGVVNFKYAKSVKYKILELKLPKSVIKSPKSMENFLATLHAIRAFISTWKDKYIKGKFQLWLTLEIVGSKKGISFYIRTPKEFQNLVESQLYAQYPEVEITEVEDYTKKFSGKLPDKNFDIWGADLMYVKPTPYPIKTYPYFEGQQKDGKRLDSLASLIEVMSRLKKDDQIWFQIPIKYTGDKWKKEADALSDKLAGRKGPPKKLSFFDFSSQFVKNLVKAPVKSPEWKFEGGGGGDPSQLMHLTEGKKEAIKAIEDKSAKLGFEAFIRFIYIARREDFNFQNINGIFGAINQFNTQNLNSFKPCAKTIPGAKAPFKAQKEFIKKKLMYGSYCLRSFNSATKSIFNVEELATLFHFPNTEVENRSLNRVRSKKGEPPTNLPVVD